MSKHQTINLPQRCVVICRTKFQASAILEIAHRLDYKWPHCSLLKTAMWDEFGEETKSGLGYVFDSYKDGKTVAVAPLRHWARLSRSPISASQFIELNQSLVS